MKLETAQALVAYGDQTGAEITLRDDYSGRGMYGRTVAAVECDFGTLVAAAAAAGADLVAAADGDQDAASELIDDLARIRSDNMGLGMIYY